MASCKRPYVQGEGDIKIALLDFGCKENIIRELVKRNCTVYIYPQDSSKDTILECKPEGILLSNGPRRPRRLQNRNRNSKRPI